MPSGIMRDTLFSTDLSSHDKPGQPVSNGSDDDGPDQGSSGHHGAGHSAHGAPQGRGNGQGAFRSDQTAGGQGNEQRQGEHLEEAADHPLRNRPAAGEEDNPAAEGDDGDYEDHSEVASHEWPSLRKRRQ